MKKILFLSLFITLNFSLWGQEQVTNIKYQNTNYTISSSFQTEDAYWYNVYSKDGSYLILVSDGTSQNTSIVNFKGLNILPNSIVDVVKFEGYYYLLIDSDLKYVLS